MISIPYDKSKYMLYFHGSPDNFNIADILHSKSYKDFGDGFYLGPNYGPARDWALGYGSRAVGYVHYYLLPKDIFTKFESHRFQKGSEKWLDFVIANRTGKKFVGFEEYLKYDIISGDTADARAKLLIDKYIDDTELIDDPEVLDLMKRKLLKKLRIDELPHQVCIKTNKCLNSIKKLAVVEVRINGVEIRRV